MPRVTHPVSCLANTVQHTTSALVLVLQEYVTRLDEEEQDPDIVDMCIEALDRAGVDYSNWEWLPDKSYDITDWA